MVIPRVHAVVMHVSSPVCATMTLMLGSSLLVVPRVGEVCSVMVGSGNPVCLSVMLMRTSGIPVVVRVCHVVVLMMAVGGAHVVVLCDMILRDVMVVGRRVGEVVVHGALIMRKMDRPIDVRRNQRLAGRWSKSRILQLQKALRLLRCKHRRGTQAEECENSHRGNHVLQRFSSVF